MYVERLYCVCVIDICREMQCDRDMRAKRFLPLIQSFILWTFEMDGGVGVGPECP